jgi:hypothetical protein
MLLFIGRGQHGCFVCLQILQHIDLLNFVLSTSCTNSGIIIALCVAKGNMDVSCVYIHLYYCIYTINNIIDNKCDNHYGNSSFFFTCRCTTKRSNIDGIGLLRIFSKQQINVIATKTFLL